MGKRDNYLDYSHLDAPDILQNVLSYFFTKEKNTSTFALPKRHFDDCLRSPKYVDARHYFRIINGTDLVTKKVISSYLTDTGTRYLIQKDYYQLVQRMLRMEKRNTLDDATKMQSPFTEFATQSPLDTDSDKDDSIKQSTIPEEVHNKTATNESPPPAMRKRVQILKRMMILPSILKLPSLSRKWKQIWKKLCSHLKHNIKMSSRMKIN